MKHPEFVGADRENSKLVFVAKLTQQLIPEYDIKQSDPLVAVNEGVGNCVAKAAVSAVMLERGKFVGATPALAWNERTHPKHGDDMLGKPRVLNGHAYLLASGTVPPFRISAISFNPAGVLSNDWEIFDFNDDGEFAKVSDGNEIVATHAGSTVGYHVENWHEGGKSYIEALGVTDSIYHQTTKEQMAKLIVDKLVEKDLLSKFE